MLKIPAIVELEVKNHAVEQMIERTVQSTNILRLRKKEDTGPSHLLIYEMGEDEEKDFSYIQTKLNASESAEIFLTSAKTDSSLLLRAMRMGVKEFFTQPLQEAEIQGALQSFIKRRKDAQSGSHGKKGKIIDIIGSKGGAGSTTIAVNLAAGFLRKNKTGSVALLDMNGFFGDIPLFLSLDPLYNWSEVTKDIHRVDETFLMNILTRHASGLCVLPAPPTSNSYVFPTADTIEHLLDIMQRLFDVIVIDGGQSFDDASLKIIERADSVLLISSLDLPFLHNTHKMLKNFDYLGYPSKDRIRIVLNRYKKGTEISLDDARKTLDHSIFWTVANDYKTASSAINHGKTISSIAPDSMINKNLLGLADRLIKGEEGDKKKRWHLFGRRKDAGK
ncbi:MAG: hypothetical protein M0P57_10275 [Syntrophales bacterium]|jgi:pilus assembly protein CpaE|nr:hypothetical protein [Syntrophales bacterium]MDY0044752.1 hypothetical protein [Syntrophales bacterium]